MSNCDDTVMVLVLGILLISNLMKIWIRRNLKFWKYSFFFFLIFEYVNNDDTIPLGILLIWDFDKDLNSKEFFSFSSFLFVSFREHDDDTMMVCDFNKDLNLMKSPNLKFRRFFSSFVRNNNYDSSIFTWESGTKILS